MGNKLKAYALLCWEIVYELYRKEGMYDCRFIRGNLVQPFGNFCTEIFLKRKNGTIWPSNRFRPGNSIPTCKAFKSQAKISYGTQLGLKLKLAWISAISFIKNVHNIGLLSFTFWFPLQNRKSTFQKSYLTITFIFPNPIVIYNKNNLKRHVPCKNFISVTYRKSIFVLVNTDKFKKRQPLVE